MSGYTEKVREVIEQMPCNEIFVANEVKKNLLSELPEAIYYKVLERLVKQDKLVHLTKGLYYRPCMENEQIIPISQESIVDYYVTDNSGVLIGEGLFIEKGIASGFERRIQVLSNKLVENRKHIGEVSVEKTDLEFNEETISVVQTLEILQNYDKISNIDKKSFVAYMRGFAQDYSEEATEYVLNKRKYKKATIAFLKELLDWFGIYNCLDEYLSPLSQYKIPTIEELRLDIPEKVRERLVEYVEGIKKIYGEHLEEVILYGSYAKGNYDEADSDIDIMILVDVPDLEVKKYRHDLSGWTYDFNEEHNLDIKPMAKNRNEFMKWVKAYPFYESVRNEGVNLYGVA